MNLIERLGGYEEANTEYQKVKNLRDSKEVEIRDKRIAFDVGILRQDMLEYRRQHNIFEAEDWIIIDSYKPEYQFYQITKDDMGSHWINLVEFRHATDAEIKAGKRLEVNQ